MKLKIECTKEEAEAILVEHFESILAQLKQKTNKSIELEVKIE